MNELFDKQVNAQKEKNLQGSHNENETNKQRRKNDACIKMLLMEGSTL